MAYPISLSEVKKHLRVDPDYFEDDDYLETIIIPASVQYCTNYTDPSSLYTDASCPYQVKQAMLVVSADLYDSERSSYSIGAIKREDVIQRLLMPYKKIYW